MLVDLVGDRRNEVFRPGNIVLSGLDGVGRVACTRHRVAPPSSDAGDFYQSLLPGALGSLPNKLRRKSPVANAAAGHSLAS